MQEYKTDFHPAGVNHCVRSLLEQRCEEREPDYVRTLLSIRLAPAKHIVNICWICLLPGSASNKYITIQ